MNNTNKMTIFSFVLLLVSCTSNKPNTIYGAGLSSTGLCEESTVQQGFTFKKDDKEAIPCLIMQPRYPREAAMNRIMGYVSLNFTLSESGRPSNIKITESVPEGVFDDVALVSFREWVFKVKKVNDSVVKQENMIYTMEFRVE
ncbi:MAG: energy transducer TonB [Kangiellaceae bacterium]